MVETKEQHKKIKFKCVVGVSIGQCLRKIGSFLKSCFSFSNIASEHQLRSSLMLEQDQLVQLLPNPFPTELLTVFFTKMIKSDLAVTFSNKFDQLKYVVIIHCCFNHVVINFPENSFQVCSSQENMYPFFGLEWVGKEGLHVQRIQACIKCGHHGKVAGRAITCKGCDRYSSIIKLLDTYPHQICTLNSTQTINKKIRTWYLP